MTETPKITTLLERLARIIQNDAYRLELKPTQWEALRFFNKANRFSASPSGLTGYLGITKGTVSQTINALERKGLIKKIPDGKDKRQVTIKTTAKGKKVLAEDPLESIREISNDLDIRLANNTEEGLTQILQALLEKGQGRPFEICNGCRHFQSHVKDGNPHRCGLLAVPLTENDSHAYCIEFNGDA